MRKFALLHVLAFLSIIGLYAKSNVKIDLSMLQPVASDSWIYEDDSIKVSMYINLTGLNGGDIESHKEGDFINSWSNTFYFKLENKSKHRIYIEWENSRLRNERPLFGTDNTLTMKNKKEDEAVAAESSSILRCLYVTKSFQISSLNINDKAEPPFDFNELKKKGLQQIKFLLPLRFEDGSTKDIKFDLTIKWTNLADINSIKIGMKDKEVKELIGKPENKSKPQKGTVIWHYTNNANITFVDDKVTEINKNK